MSSGAQLEQVHARRAARHPQAQQRPTRAPAQERLPLPESVQAPGVGATPGIDEHRRPRAARHGAGRALACEVAHGHARRAAGRRPPARAERIRRPDISGAVADLGHDRVGPLGRALGPGDRAGPLALGGARAGGHAGDRPGLGEVGAVDPEHGRPHHRGVAHGEAHGRVPAQREDQRSGGPRRLLDLHHGRRRRGVDADLVHQRHRPALAPQAHPHAVGRRRARSRRASSRPFHSSWTAWPARYRRLRASRRTTFAVLVEDRDAWRRRCA